MHPCESSRRLGLGFALQARRLSWIQRVTVASTPHRKDRLSQSQLPSNETYILRTSLPHPLSAQTEHAGGCESWEQAVRISAWHGQKASGADRIFYHGFLVQVRPLAGWDSDECLRIRDGDLLHLHLRMQAACPLGFSCTIGMPLIAAQYNELLMIECVGNTERKFEACRVKASCVCFNFPAR